MPVDETTNSLRLVLEKKSTEELEELLALDFTENEDDKPNVEYIMTILEVIHEREGDTPEKQAELDAAWNEFQEIIREEEQAETGTTEKPNLDHPCKTEYGQASRKHTRVLRYCAVVAAVIILFCGSAYAAGWNIFQALAEWTAETFSFLTGDEQEEPYGQDVFEFMRLEVATWSETPAVPKWAPEGTEQSGEIEVAESSRGVRIMGAFIDNKQEFTILISVYHTIPNEFPGTYQKDSEMVQEYEVGGITHYIVGNNENISVMWTNGNIEGHIQGALSIGEAQEMIDSIYEE